MPLSGIVRRNWIDGCDRENYATTGRLAKGFMQLPAVLWFGMLQDAKIVLELYVTSYQRTNSTSFARSSQPVHS